MTSEDKSVSEKLGTGNEGNFMLLLDPLSEEKAVFTSVRCSPEPEESVSTELNDTIETPDESGQKEDGKTSSDTYVKNGVPTVTIPPLSACFTSTVNMVSSSTPAASFVSNQPTGTFGVSCVGSSGSFVYNKIPSNKIIINNEQNIIFPASAPLIVIPPSNAGQSQASVSLPTSVIQSGGSTNSFSKQSFTAASSFSQTKVVSQTGRKQPPMQHNSMNPSSFLDDKNIQILYPATFNSSNPMKVNTLFIPNSTPQAPVIVTLPSNAFSAAAASTVPPPKKVNSKPLSRTIFLPPAASISHSTSLLPSSNPSLISKVISQSASKTNITKLPSSPIIKITSAGTKASSESSIIISTPNSLLATQNTCTSAVASPQVSTIFVGNNSPTSTAERLVIKKVSPKQPIMVKLQSGEMASISAEAIENAGKTKTTIGHIVISTSPRGKTSNSVSQKSTESILAGSSSAVHTKTLVSQNTDKTKFVITPSTQPQELKIDNVYSLAGRKPKSIVKGAAQSAQTKISPEHKSGVTDSSKLVDSLAPCYPVLEKLSDRQIAHIMTSITEQKRDKFRRRLRNRNRPTDYGTFLERKCSSYCRQRTLRFLCRLGMLDCKHLSSKDQRKVVKVTKQNDNKQNSVQSSQNGKFKSITNILNSSSNGTKSCNKVVKGVQSNVAVQQSKGLPMQLLMVNNKLYLVPVQNNVSSLVPAQIISTGANTVPTTAADVRTKLLGLQQGGGLRPLNVIQRAPSLNLPRNIGPPLPTFRPCFVTNVPPVSVTGNSSSSLPTCSGFRTQIPKMTPIIIRAPNIKQPFKKEVEKTNKPISTNKTDGKPDAKKDNKTDGKKIEPWKLPWNYEIKSEPVTEGYGDEDDSSKSEDLDKMDHTVMTIRLPFQKPTSSSLPDTVADSTDISNETGNTFIQSKLMKTGSDLVIKSSQSDRIQRLKEILREKEKMLEAIKRKQTSLGQ